MEPLERVETGQPTADRRLYVPCPEGWQAHIKTGWEKLYCYQKDPGEDYYHLILSGEIYLQCGDETICLTCALRRGIATPDRLYWQHRVPVPQGPPPM